MPRQLMAAQNRRRSAIRTLDQMQGGTYTDRVETLAWSYYDSLTVPATAQTAQMFQVPISGTKTISDTNMVTAGIIPNGQNYTIKTIGIGYRSTSGLTSAAEQLEFQSFIDRAVLRFRISNKAPMIEIPLSQIMGMRLLAPMVQAAGTVAANTVQMMTGIYKLPVPIKLGSLAPFTVEVAMIDTPAASVAGDVVRVYLGGILRRAM